MFRGKTPRVWSLLTLLLAYGLLALLPMIWVGAYLLLRVAQAERAQLEERVHQIAEAVAGDVERELQRRLTLLETLATSPRLSEGDFAKFYVQAKAAIEAGDQRPSTYALLGEALTMARVDLKVVLMSGGSNGGPVVLTSGWAFIQKPFVPANLVQTIRRVLRIPDRFSRAAGN